MLSLAKLKKSGFAKTGRLGLVENGPGVIGAIPTEPGIYLYVLDGKVHYVGKSDKSLRRRILAYARGLGRDLPRRKVHLGILEAFKAAKHIEIYTRVIADNRDFYKDGLPIEYLVGLEAGLIAEINPDWNPFNAAGRARRALGR